jgi:polyisoprenyl-teichoic acid--peptidoglycan teichoic acid transferase
MNASLPSNPPRGSPSEESGAPSGRSYRSAFQRILCTLLLLALAACNYPIPTTGAPTPGYLPGDFSSPSPPLVALFPNHPTPTPFPPLPPTPVTPAPGLVTPTPQATHTATIPPPTPAATTRAWPSPNPAVLLVTKVPPPVEQLSDPETINFLLLGSDRRTSSYRTDTLVVASLRPRDHLVTLISFPRDLFVYIPGLTMQRINTAYQRGDLSSYPGGGPELLKDTFLYNFGIPIDHVAMVDFNGFQKIIDTLGGIDVPVACAYTDWRLTDPSLKLSDPANWHLYTAGPGLVQMDGDLALWYARSRLRSSDFDRGRRQQELLRAIFVASLRLDILPRLPALYDDLASSVETDLTLRTLLDLVPYAANLGLPNVRSFYINRDHLQGWRTPQGAAVQLPKQPALQELLQEAMSPPSRLDEEHHSILVEIWNGTRKRHLDSLAADRLHYAGFETRLAPADRDDYAQSILVDFTPNQDDPDREFLLQLLGLPASALQAAPDPKSPISYLLILGADYNPCFNPAKITRP